MNERTVFEDMVSILHTESPQRTDSQVRKAHKIKSGLQGHEKKKEKKKRARELSNHFRSKTSQFSVSFSLSSNLPGVSIITAAKKS